MKITEKIKFIKNDILLKTLYSAAISLVITIAFGAYNAYLGAKYGDSFGTAISIYYFLLCTIKGCAIFAEKKLLSNDNARIPYIRKRNYVIISIFVFLLNICLITPVIMIVVAPKDISFGIIPAITMAAYSTYKITVAIINYVKSKKSQNLTVILIRQVNVIDALVSIMSLQHTLIMVNGGMEQEMYKLSLASSIAIIIFIMIFSIVAFFKNKNQQQKQNQNE